MIRGQVSGLYLGFHFMHSTHTLRTANLLLGLSTLNVIESDTHYMHLLILLPTSVNLFSNTVPVTQQALVMIQGYHLMVL